jgi:hypothetical protein
MREDAAMYRTFIAAALATTTLTGCVNHTWAPGPTANMPFAQASGQCKMAALGSQEGFAAVGRPAFVVGSAIGNAIGNAVRANATFNACLEAQGFVAVEESAR